MLLLRLILQAGYEQSVATMGTGMPIVGNRTWGPAASRFFDETHCRRGQWVTLRHLAALLALYIVLMPLPLQLLAAGCQPLASAAASDEGQAQQQQL